MACASVSWLPGKAFADPAKANVMVSNSTNTRVHYQLKWGNNAWKDFDVEPGFYYSHTYKYNPMGVLPPHISFVSAPGFEGGLRKSYELRIGWDNNPTQYHFERNDRGELDLFKD